MGEAIQGWLAAVGIRTKMRATERGAFMTAWREKVRGVVLTISGVSGNTATRLESFVTKNGAFAYGALPEVDDLFRNQARELDRKSAKHFCTSSRVSSASRLSRRQSITSAFPSCRAACGGHHGHGHPRLYMSPYEDLKLRRP